MQNQKSCPKIERLPNESFWAFSDRKHELEQQFLQSDGFIAEADYLDDYAECLYPSIDDFF